MQRWCTWAAVSGHVKPSQRTHVRTVRFGRKGDWSQEGTHLGQLAWLCFTIITHRDRSRETESEQRRQETNG